MNAVIELPEPVARRGISEAQWRTMANNLFPGAKSESVIMVWDYCVARKLDPLKKPCHIVPMQVKDQRSGDYIWRDVVMPGIYEYRTTATRTGFYLGHSKPVYGPIVKHLNVEAPEYCELTIYRWNESAKLKAEYPVQVFFREVAATKKDKKTSEYEINDRWSRAPVQMLTKCTEAAGLREAFPDELGGTQTSDEMEGQVIVEAPTIAIDPRPALENVDWELGQKHVSAIADILAQDKDENGIAEDLRQYEAEYLARFHEVYIWVQDKLASENIISKSKFKEYLKLGLSRDHG